MLRASEDQRDGYQVLMDNTSEDEGGKAIYAGIRLPLVILLALAILVGVYFLAR